MTMVFQKVVDSITGAEGMVFNRAGRFFCVAPDRGQVLALDDEGALRELANTRGIPAGLQVDARDRLWLSDMKLGILRISPEGAITDVIREYEGAPVRGCNDLDVRQALLYGTGRLECRMPGRRGLLPHARRRGATPRLGIRILQRHRRLSR